MIDIQEIMKTNPLRVTEMQFGDTVFNVISVECDRAKERLYDKVKRLILDSDALDTPPAA